MKLKRSRRGISEIIVTMMLLGITAVGGIVLWGLFSGGSDFQDVGSVVSSSVTSQRVFILTGYDTRDGTDISGIDVLDNTFDGQLSEGEFIVLKLRNEHFDSADIRSIKINEVRHKWDELSSGDVSSSPPTEGEFTVISDSSSSRLSQEVPENTDVRVVISLSDDLEVPVDDDEDDDGGILLNKEMDIIVQTSGVSTISQFFIPSGGVR